MNTSNLLTLRFSRFWFLLGMAIVTLVVTACLVPSHVLPTVGVSDKIEHGVAFFTLTIWFAGLLPRRDYVFLFLAMIALGGGIEVAQGLMGLGREADIWDLVADAKGVCAGVAVALTPLGRWPSLLEGLLVQRIA
jgi:VanZ family protein